MIKDLKYILQLSSFVLLSCSSVHVDRGPFKIISAPESVAKKQAYLSRLENFTNTGEKPNVLIILVDDLAKHDISVYDSAGVNTPNLQLLADEGVLFTKAFTSSPVCSPSRAAFLTGRYQQRFGFERQPMNRYSRNRIEYFIVDHFMNVEPMRLIEPMADVPRTEVEKQGIPEDEILLSEILKYSGYKTALCGKWHLGNASQFNPNKKGFDYHYGFYEAFTLYAEEKTKGIIEHRHDYFANKHIWKQKRNGSSAIRINDSIVNEEEYLTFAIARESIDFMKRNKNQPFFLLSAFNAPHTPFQVPVEYYDKFSSIDDPNKRVYYGMIAALDDAIGMILQALLELNLDKNTLIVFASDNGGAAYTGATDNGPLSGGKFSQFEGGVNIPLIMKYGEILEGGTSYEKQVSLFDVYPTVCGLAGIEQTNLSKIDGVDLLSILEKQDEHAHEYLYWRTDFNKAIRNDNWKLIWNIRDNQYFLFDVSEDNYERNNVATLYPEVVQELQKVYSNWESEMKDALWPGVMEIRIEENGVETWWAI
jgi:arylsulfatase A-like enzyme